MGSRRRFVKQACGAVVMSELVTIGGCQPSVHDLDGDDGDIASPEATVTPNGNLVLLPLAEYPGLTSIDGVAYVYVDSVQLYIVVARLSDTDFVAVNGICTHASCSLSFNGPTDEFRCGCHGARFAADGAVLAGPTNVPLPTFPATFDGTTVTVDITGA